jgi:hypothetical protein
MTEIILKRKTEETKKKVRPEKIGMDGVRWSMTNHGVTEENTGHRELVWVKENHCRRDKSLD